MELKTLTPFLDRLLVALPVDRRDGRRALELQVAVLEVLVPHLKGSHSFSHWGASCKHFMESQPHSINF